MTTETNSGALKIEWDELYSEETESQVQDIITARSVPLVREVGAATEAKPAWYRGQIAQMSLAGLLGGLFAWGLTRASFPRTGDVGDGQQHPVHHGARLRDRPGRCAMGWHSDEILGQDQDRADPHRPGAGRSDPARGDRRRPDYQPWIESVFTDIEAQAYTLDWTADQFYDALSSAMHLPRGVAWAVVGLVVGLAIGIGSRNKQKIINGALGGFAGGLIGGFMFDFFTSGPAARAFGIMITGLAIGLGIALVERARRQHRLEIVSGGMAGKQFILYSDRTTIGTAPDNDVTLIKDPAIAPYHAVLSASADSLELAAQSRPTPRWSTAPRSRSARWSTATSCSSAPPCSGTATSPSSPWWPARSWADRAPPAGRLRIAALAAAGLAPAAAAEPPRTSRRPSAPP